MAIDTQTEELFTLNEARKFLPSIGGRHISLPSTWRWCRKGIQGVRMEYVRVGRRIYATRSAVDRFLNNLAAADKVLVDAAQAMSFESAPSREERSQAAISRALSKKILDEAGI